MKTIAWRYRECCPENLPDGPWNEEPDKVQWRDEVTGLACAAVRHPMLGTWAGYVGVPDGHPACGLDWRKVRNTLEAHGGVNFSRRASLLEPAPAWEPTLTLELEPLDEPDLWWFGFDCAHGFDKQPFHISLLPGGALQFLDDSRAGRAYRDLDYVQRNCADLALQLRDFKPTNE